jgi:hypothetical protein
MPTETVVKRLADKVASARAVVVAKRKQGTPEDLDDAKAALNAAVAEYDQAVDTWAEAGFPKADQ